MTDPFASLPLTDAMLAGIVEISADAIIAVDEEQAIVFFNAGAEQTFGYTAADAIGRPLEDLLPARFRSSHHRHVQRFGVSDEPARRMGERSQISGLRRNGEEFPAEASIARVKVENRVVYTVVLRDVTLRQRIEHELRVAIESRDQMSGIVSHDLRNPVQAVKMLSSAILKREGDDRVVPEVAEQVAIIRRAAEQMDALIEDLADVTRIESGRLVVHPTAIDPVTLIELACDTLYPLAEARQLELRVDFPDSLPAILADPDRVIQVFSNVIGNAMKFSPAGTTIHVSATALVAAANVEEATPGAQGVRHAITGDAVIFTVADAGPGIPASHLPHVFNRYWQSSRAVRPGSGLGLTIAKGIVEAHGGWIEVESIEGNGTTVCFALPRAS